MKPRASRSPWLLTGLLWMVLWEILRGGSSFAQLASSAEGAGGNPVRRFVLDPMKVVRVPVARDRLTTVRFPSPISHLEAALVSAEPHPQALFQVYFNSGEAFFSLAALKPHSDTTLNVVWRQQTYVFELVESGDPWLSVILEDPRSAKAPGNATRPPSPERLATRIETAKNFRRLQQEQPIAVMGVRFSKIDAVARLADLSITIAETYQFPADNIVVCLLVFENPGFRTYRFDPASIGIRVKDRLHVQAATDASGVLPSHSTTRVYMAIAGNTDAIAADLSPTSPMSVLTTYVPHASPLDAPSPPPLTDYEYRPSWWSRNFSWLGL